MHTVEEIRREYDRLDRLCGVDTSAIEIGISDRAVRRLGSFRFSEDGKRLRITISAQLLDRDEAFWDTVRHEYAHAVVYLRHPGERHGHDAVWKAVCREVGCTPKSTAPAAETAQTRSARARWKIRCESCGQETYYLRRGKVVDALLRGRGRSLRCAKCGGSRFSLYGRE